MTLHELEKLAHHIKQWGRELGFDQVGITGINLAAEEPRLQAWLDAGFHGQMHYMAQHGMLRARPAELHPGTLRVISVRMNYLPSGAAMASTLRNPMLGYISRYALGRDYHKVLRQRLKQLGEKIDGLVGDCGFRPFVDSAPLLERPLAANAGLGWVGKHSLVLNAKAGSFFFLGELLVNLPLPTDEPDGGSCGNCVACMTLCPTAAIVAPYTVDARRCISYLTIELKEAIPEELRALVGNRIFGCDDCQLACPWNKFAVRHTQPDFQPRHGLDAAGLAELFAWDEATFLQRTEGSAIRRTGHAGWLRNIAVALGNAPTTPEVLSALAMRRDDPDPMVREHVAWALARHPKASSPE